MSLVRLLLVCCVSLRVRATFKVCSPLPSPSPQAKAAIKLEGEGEHTLNVALTLKLTQQSSNKRTKDIHEVNRVKGLKGLKYSLVAWHKSKPG